MELISKIIEKSVDNTAVILISAILISFSWYFLFSKRKYVPALVALTLGLISVWCLEGFLEWIIGLGADSFLELDSFDLGEAIFFVSTLPSYVLQMFRPLSKATFLIVTEALILSVLFYSVIRWRPMVIRGLVLVLGAAILFLVNLGYSGFELGRAHIHALKNNFDLNPIGFKAFEDIDLFVYIGESTSSMNMSLYGYPLATTPLLDALHRSDKGFLRFDKVRSTHTHTSDSLLRAFAVTSTQPDGRPIQWGLGKVLKQAGLKPHLYSVQPVNGSFAAFSRFVFDGFVFDRPKEDRYKGNLASLRVKDHQLLGNALESVGVVFFHSYAGHGPYLDFIDISMSNAVSRPTINFDGVYGSLLSEFLTVSSVHGVSDYDQAITYIDRNVSHAIKNIKSRSKPAVLMYFSDHGDSVYTRRSHDSSKFIDEMSTVPMVIYFNKAYQKKYPEIVDQYQKAALIAHTRLLDQASPTILDILRISSKSQLDVPTLASLSKHPRHYIIKRDTVSGPSRIDLDYNKAAEFSKVKFNGGTPEPTYISIINEKFGKENTICYHRSNSFAKSLRAAAITNCLEFDLVVDGDELNVYHPPAIATGFRIEHIFSIAQERKNSLWIDSKNLDKPKACNKLVSYLESNHTRVGQIFVEFPPSEFGLMSELQSCGQRLRSINVRSSYYIPTHLLVPCAENATQNAVACKELNDNVQKAMSSGIFSDLSFDFRGYSAMKRLMGAENFRWNTWTVKPQDFSNFPRQDFDFIIMDTSTDPNTY